MLNERILAEQRPRILIAEDEVQIVKIIRMILSDFQLDIALNGSEALELYSKSKNYLLVLTDNKMPGITGLELTKRIKEMNPNQNIAVHSSDINDPKVKKEFESAGAKFFVPKPSSVQQIRALVDRP